MTTTSNSVTTSSNLGEIEERMLQEALSAGFSAEIPGAQSGPSVAVHDNARATNDETREMENALDSAIDKDGHSVAQRFRGAVWFERMGSLTVTLAGVGGIGSYVAFLLSRLGIGSLTIYDPDTVEDVNLAGQMYRRSDIGRRKVDAMSRLLSDFSRSDCVFAVPNRFTEMDSGGKVMLCGFDNMQARKDYFKAWVRYVTDVEQHERRHCLFIDGRLNAEEFQVYCIRGNDSWAIRDYAEHQLFDDSEAQSDVCSYKQTTFCAVMIASVMVNLLVNWATNWDVDTRSVPYYTQWDARTMLMKQE